MKTEEGETTDDIIRDLKLGCVANNSKKCYTSAIVSFLQYIYKFDKFLMHKTWIKSINNFTHNVRAKKKKKSIEKRMIRRLLNKADEKCPPINFETYEAKHFMKSLGNNCGRRLSIASYCNKCSALSHLFRLYETKLSKKILPELGTMFKGLKRKVALEQQAGKGRIQTGKSAISFHYTVVSMSTCWLQIQWNLHLLVPL